MHSIYDASESYSQTVVVGILAELLRNPTLSKLLAVLISAQPKVFKISSSGDSRGLLVSVHATSTVVWKSVGVA